MEKPMRLPGIILILVAILTMTAFGLDQTEEAEYYKSPAVVADGIIYTDNNASAVYHFAHDSVTELISSRGCGQYLEIAPDKQSIGLKLIDADGDQTPVVLDIRTGEIRKLHPSAGQIGQVSFTRDGRAAYTVAEKLIVSDGRTVDLGYYANIAPISPDGRQSCFNDADDQLWIITIATGEKIRISDEKTGYYYPKWSSDGNKILYSAFNGDIKVYELASARTYTIPSGDNPTWSDDSRNILFSRKEIVDNVLIDSDVYLADYTGSSISNLTQTPDVIEMDASFGNSVNEILYHTYQNRMIVRTSLNSSKSGLESKDTKVIRPERLNVTYFPSIETVAEGEIMNVPYLHQVYDVPNWFWGYYACAPTTAAMLLAYYNILPVWSTNCSNPSVHTSRWGRYICEEYYYREVDYSYSSSPNGHTAGKGGYGYMWGTGGSPNSCMANYYRNHGLTTSQTWPSGDLSPTWSTATSEIANGFPFTMCVWLTSSGHLILAKGVVAGKHSLVFNDPYGNRNTPGYPSYDGAGATYDWPGYNEGNVNLAYAGTGIPWCIAAHYTVPTVSDSLIDDLNLAQGFNLKTVPPASMAYWKDKKTGGYYSHFWYTSSRTPAGTDVCAAEWAPQIERVGLYEISVYIPVMSGLTTNALYHIRTSAGDSTMTIDQNINQGSWVSLGRHYYDAGNGNVVYLGDGTGESGKSVAFDALKWKFVERPTVKIVMNTYTGDWDREGPPKTVYFTGLPSYLAENAIYHWDFGDGCFSDSLNAMHIFRSAGTFMITFTVLYGDEQFSADTTLVTEPFFTGDFTLLVPENAATMTTTTPLFYWLPGIEPGDAASKSLNANRSNLLAGFDRFELYLHRNSSFNEVEPVILDTNAYRSAMPLLENTEYFWTIVAEDTGGVKTLSAIWSFIINAENEPPASFTLISPTAKTVTAVLTPTFNWNQAEDADLNDDVAYRLKIGTEIGNLQVVYEGAGTDFTLVDSLRDNTIYFWQVEAIDGSGAITANSDGVRSFAVNLANDPPQPVTLLAPEDGTYVTDDYPLFMWTVAQDVDPYETLKYYLIYWRTNETNTLQYSTDTTFCNRRKMIYGREYNWYVKVVDKAGDFAISDTFKFVTVNVGIAEEPVQPETFALRQNYPNPFNPTTTICFDLPQTGKVVLNIYDMNGRWVRTLLNESKPPGIYRVIWGGRQENGTPVSAGVYIYVLKYDAQVLSRKMIFLK
ncbi:MAG: T9SS type A sorting domain-containing protein [Candidatus Neomarinimicrobiota bacterium]